MPNQWDSVQTGDNPLTLSGPALPENTTSSTTTECKVPKLDRLKITLDSGDGQCTQPLSEIDACFKACQERAKCKTEQCRQLTKEFVEAMTKNGCKVGARSKNLNKTFCHKTRKTTKKAAPKKKK